MSTEKSARPARRTFLITSVVALVVTLFTLGAGNPAGAKSKADERPAADDRARARRLGRRIVLDQVIKRLQHKGFTVVAPPNLLRGPATDAAYLASYLQTISGPIVLVAHSYGGFVATNAATGNANVKALVYIDAFIPEEGETAGDLARARAPASTRSAQLRALRRRPGSVPALGGERVLSGLHRVLRQRGRPEGGRGSCRRAAARGRRAVHRALRAPGVEDDPVLVTHRDVGQRDPAPRCRRRCPAGPALTSPG